MSDKERVTVSVSVEKYAHDAMRRLAQELWNKHNIAIESVSFSWVDTSSVAAPDMAVADVSMRTLTKEGKK